jgi:kynurenine formamidase
MPELIDLSREIYHKMPHSATQPVASIWTQTSHAETGARLGGRLSFAGLGMVLSDHAGTHVDAFSHYDASPDAPSVDQMPLAMFYTEAICLDFSSLAPRAFITVEHLSAALAQHRLEIRPGDAVLLRTGHYADDQPAEIVHATGGTEAYMHGFPGLDRRATEWLADQGVVNVGTEARSIDSPAVEHLDADDPYAAHVVFRDRRSFTITENLLIPRRLVGRRFRFIAFPLRIRGGTGSPVRAVAVLDG